MQKLRKFANDAMSTFKGRATMFNKATLMYHGSLNNVGETGEETGLGQLKTVCTTTTTSVHGRDAVMAVAEGGELKTLADYVKKLVPKSLANAALIYKAIKANILFANCYEEELREMVDAFECVEVPGGMTVIQQVSSATLNSLIYTTHNYAAT